MSIVATSQQNGTALTQDLADIFNEHAKLVYRTAYGVTGRHEDAEDVLQTIFLRLVRRQFLPDLTKNPKAYLYRAAVNLSLDTIQSRSRLVLVEDVNHFEIVSTEKPGVDDELHRRLYEAIAQLKPESAHILILRYIHDFSDAEIARTLGVSRGTIALRLFRSRARLKKLLRTRAGEMP